MMPPVPSGARLPNWYRVLATVIGLISIALAFVVLADPTLGLLTLVFLLGFALLVIGIDRLVAGISGHPYGILQVPSGGPPGSAPSHAPLTPGQPPKP